MGDGSRLIPRWTASGLVMAVVAVAVAAPTIAGAHGRSAAVSRHAVAATHVRLVSTEQTVDPDLHVVGNELENASGAAVRLIGVDATGTEDACIQDKGFSWGPLDAAEADSIAAWHANAVRVPLNEDCWLGINGAPAAYSGAAYQSALNAAGLVAILDLHESAPGAIVSDRDWQMADESHAVTFWNQVASTFKSDPLVMFDLFNEPHLGAIDPTAADWSCWLNGCTTTWNECLTTSLTKCGSYTYQVAGMQQLVDTVRATGADQPIMLGGLDFSGTLCKTHGPDVQPGCAWTDYEPVDPLHQLVASFHNYAEAGGCHTEACWDATLTPLAAKVPVVTGELGDDDCTAAFVAQYMQWADLHGVSYLVWAWQANTYSSTCEPGHLLSTWNGAPSRTNPLGELVSGHFAQIGAKKL